MLKPMIRTNAWYGWQPDLPDHRDFSYATERMKLEAPRRLPEKVDLRNDWMTAAYDQGELGSCTANAIGAAFEYEHLRMELGPHCPSRLFIYYGERVMEGTVMSDAGAQIRDGIKVVASQGAPAEKLWPYDIRKFTKKPPAKVYKAAARHVAVSYYRLDHTRLNELLKCLAGGHPFIFGFTVYENFEGAKVARTGVLDMPRRKDRVLGGHAVLAAGYDQERKRFLVRNSWGLDWGRKGYFTMPFDYLLDGDLAEDFWTIRAVS